MADTRLSFREGIMYILLGGVVLFVAIFLGIRTGFALRSSGPSEITPETLPNQSLLEMSTGIPSLQVRDSNGSLHTLSDITVGKKTVIGILLPGCGPCKKLLKIWERKEILHNPNGTQIILLVAGPQDNVDLGELTEYVEDYPVYFCDMGHLDAEWGISSFPSVIGIGTGNLISFIANGYVNQLDNEFFLKYL
jgi:hypothetical protein